MKYQINEKLVSNTYHDMLMIVSLENHEVYFSNEVGAFIWEQLKKGHDDEEILKSILENFEVEEEVARADLEEFLEKLLERNIIFKNKGNN